MTERTVVLLTTSPSLEEPTRDLATRIARRANATLLFLHIIPIRAEDGEAMLYATVDLSEGETERWLEEQAPSDPWIPSRRLLVAGDPGKVVLQFCATYPVEAVVVEDARRGWIRTLLQRNVAGDLSRVLPCPIVIAGPGYLEANRQPEVAPTLPLPSRAGEMLRAMVDARVDALRCWMDNRATDTARIGRSAAVESFVGAVEWRRGLSDVADEAALRVVLDEHRRAQRACGWWLQASGRTWSNLDAALPRSPAVAEFLVRVKQQGHSTSLPVAIGEGGERVVILSGTSLGRSGSSLLLLAFDVEDDFNRILVQPGPLPTFETYAFDRTGLMLSHSRFPHHLEEAGLLSSSDPQTTLRLRVAEPSVGPRELWPLTRMARAATSAQDGEDFLGYADYRGTPVVGAWRWVAEYGFGVTAELDRRVALES